MNLVKQFSTILHEAADPIWTKILTHPFIQEMCAGTLPLDKFQYYLMQDYYYLMNFVRCLGLLVAKDVKHIHEFSTVLHNSITIEVNELERLGYTLGLNSEMLRTVNPAPTNLAYTRHLFFIAYTGTTGELMAGLLPCMWTYQEIGETLGESEAVRQHTIYSTWGNTYISPAYRQLVSWYKQIVDHHAETAGTRVREAMRRHFVLSSRYEYLFWEMAYNKEQWPI
jgi:thiaminase/transcriptional activator TenA